MTDKGINIHPSGTPKDRTGDSSSKDMRETQKNYGTRTVIGVIRDGEYVDPETGKPIRIGSKKIGDISVNILTMGGKEY